jgi:hypothetical protein
MQLMINAVRISKSNIVALWLVVFWRLKVIWKPKGALAANVRDTVSLDALWASGARGSARTNQRRDDHPNQGQLNLPHIVPPLRVGIAHNFSARILSVFS